MKTFLFALLLSSSAFAGEFGTLVCKDCDYQMKVLMGGTRYQSKQGLSSDTFFCKKTKQFVVRQFRTHKGDSPVAPEIEKLLAKSTSALVDPKMKYHLFTDSTCENALVPIDYYRKNPKIPCPVCNKGTVEIKDNGFVD